MAGGGPLAGQARSAPAVRLGHAIGLALAVLGVACLDGYPTEDVAQPSPFDLTAEQRLQALNELASQAHDQAQWRYRMDSACSLSVSRRRGQEGWITVHHRLDDSRLETWVDPDGDIHHLQLAPASGAGPVSVLHSADRLLVQQGLLLVQLLTRDCVDEARPPEA